jgi:membrane fusion protein (multidrug efflux system)
MLRHRPGPLLLALGLALAAGCSDGEASRGDFKPEPVVVEVMRVQPEAVREVVTLTGQLEAELSVKVRPDTAGVLETIEFAEGQEVSQGTVLFRLRDQQERARLREAQAEMELKKLVFERTRKLAQRDITSPAALDRARAELARETARVEAARADLERTRIRAPFDGMMGALYVAPGARIEPDVVLTQIDKIDRLQIVFSLPEVAVGLARPGIPFEFTVAPFPDEEFPGEVYFVAPTLDPQTRRMLVKGWVPNPDRRLRPGLFANIQAEVGRHDDALMVPESALALDREGTFVWRVSEQDVAERVAVQTGLRIDGRVQIVRGLDPGNRVVAAGTNKVKSGSVVRAAAPPASRPAPGLAPGSAPERAAASRGAGEGS